MSTKHIPYLELDPHIQQALAERAAEERLHPLRCKNENCLRREQNPNDEPTVLRSSFQRDIDKIVNIPAYNRYAGKTQVFSFVEKDTICRRGLHVQLVSRIARTIGKILGLNCDLIEAIALGHDVGHTPFGHAGERYLSKVYHEATGRYFNHNVNSVRVLDKLYPRNISLQVLDGALCHNGEFEQQVLQLGTTTCFEELDAAVEACNADESHIATLRPSTLEGCVVRVADMIAYIGKDRDDALEMGVIPSLEVFDTEILGRDNSTIINNLTVDIINTSFGQDHIAMSEEIFKDLKLAKQQNYEIIYLKEGLIDSDKNLVEEMFARLYERLKVDVLERNTSSPLFTEHIPSLTQKSRAWTAESYLKEDTDVIVCDYLSSLTDAHFTALYEYLFPDEKVNPSIRGYYPR